MARKKSAPRKTHKFQLRQNCPEDLHVQEIVEYWRSKKQGVTKMRNAIALYYALEQGDQSVLQQMFPAYKPPVELVEIKNMLASMTVQKVSVNTEAPPLLELQASAVDSNVDVVGNFMSMFD